MKWTDTHVLKHSRIAPRPKGWGKEENKNSALPFPQSWFLTNKRHNHDFPFTPLTKQFSNRLCKDISSRKSENPLVVYVGIWGKGIWINSPLPISHGEEMVCLLNQLFKFSPQLWVSSVWLPKEASQISCSLHLGFCLGCAKERIISPDARYSASSTEQGNHNTQPTPGLNWEMTVPSTLTYRKFSWFSF